MKKIIIILIILIQFSCNEEKFTRFGIDELTEGFTGELQHRTQLRLAFGKTVARAMSDKDFRDYLKTASLREDIEGFNEIVFGIHHNAEISVGKTLKDHLGDNIDDEVFGLFGEDFLDEVLEYDPLVVIKLPDIFFEFNWTDDIIPLIYVVTPTKLDFGIASNYYSAYHHSGYQEKAHFIELPEYFCVVVKYSEDHILLNSSQFNEKGLSLFEEYPQIDSKSWDIVKENLTNDIVTASHLDGFEFFSKKDIYKTYNDIASKQLNLVENDQDCHLQCKRNCLPIDSLNTVYDRLIIHRLISFDPARIYIESLPLLLHVWNYPVPSTPEIVSQLGIHGIHITEFINTEISISHESLEKRIEDLGKISLPKIAITHEYVENSNGFNMDKTPFIEGWNDKDRKYGLWIYNVNYSDEVNYQQISYQPSGSFEINSSDVIPFGNIFLSYCDPYAADYTFGNLASLRITY